MSSALQVSFRGLPPTEELVALAAEQYRLIHRERPGFGECLVVIQAAQDARRPIAHALVRIGDASESGAQQAEARHSDPQVALRRAIGAMRLQLALPRVAESGVGPWGPELAARPLKARADCIEATSCDDLTPCDRFMMQCPAREEEITTLVIEECPDLGILSRLDGGS